MSETTLGRAYLHYLLEERHKSIKGWKKDFFGGKIYGIPEEGAKPYNELAYYNESTQDVEGVYSYYVYELLLERFQSGVISDLITRSIPNMDKYNRHFTVNIPEKTALSVFSELIMRAEIWKARDGLSIFFNEKGLVNFILEFLIYF